MKQLQYIISIVFWVTQVNATISNASNIAVVNISNIFQQSSQRAEIIKQLEYEFKDRANELEMMENDLQEKIQKLHQDGANMHAQERQELEKSLITQRELFSNKAKIFQQENHARQTEEREKILNVIHNIVKNIAKKEGYDMVIDSNAVAYYDDSINNITYDVIKKVK